MSIERAYLKEVEVARMLGRSPNWLKANRKALEREGFPRVDGLIGLTCVWDIEAWIAKRRQVSDAVLVGTHSADDSKGECFDAF